MTAAAWVTAGVGATLLPVRRLLALAGAGATYSISIPSITLRNGHIDGLLRDALRIALLRGDDLLHWIVDNLFHSVLVYALLGLSLRVNVRGLAGAVERRRHDGAPDGELLVLPESAQAALSASAGA